MTICSKPLSSSVVSEGARVLWLRVVVGTAAVTYLLVQAVRNGSSRGLVNDPEYVEARNGAGVFGGLALGVVEVGGHSDHCIGNSLRWEHRQPLRQVNIQITSPVHT